ncbi:glycohydrolase toxin TNT-related protein [Actinokineospora sp. PR83]|uniref:glycohydrolase toxin TNT-related protein n=1 Tax=Actinokineospora sp. PR83 TaxID=2884908 RepID=UPI0027E12AFD|nr:glycohydrolase toxin TNT-related protein [Actinokineospora sp. PR83]MCG8918984.1 glycohydrolase toxin TNT-related protein [Actinokineospora sp. PR83]
MAQPTQLNPTEQDALVKQIGLALLRAAPENWKSIGVEYRALGRYTETAARVTFQDETVEPFQVAQETAALFGRLRAGMYREGRGTWYNARYQLDQPSAYNLEYDRDEPQWLTPPPPPAYADDLRTFPRDEENVPEWLVRRMAALKPPFRVARIFDAPGPDGRPSVNRPPVDEADHEALLRYLDSAPLPLPARGFDTDLLDEEGRQTVPVAFHTDGAWIWPAAVNYYFRNHGVPPEPELVEQARRAEFTVPEVPEQALGAVAGFLTRGPVRPPRPPVRPGAGGAPGPVNGTKAETPVGEAPPARPVEDPRPEGARFDAPGEAAEGPRSDAPAEGTRFDASGEADRDEAPAAQSRFDDPAEADRFDAAGEADRHEAPARQSHFDEPAESARFDDPAEADRHETSAGRSRFDAPDEADRREAPAGRSRFEEPAESARFDSADEAPAGRSRSDEPVPFGGSANPTPFDAFANTSVGAGPAPWDRAPATEEPQPWSGGGLPGSQDAAERVESDSPGGLPGAAGRWEEPGGGLFEPSRPSEGRRARREEAAEETGGRHGGEQPERFQPVEQYADAPGGNHSQADDRSEESRFDAEQDGTGARDDRFATEDDHGRAESAEAFRPGDRATRSGDFQSETAAEPMPERATAFHPGGDRDQSNGFQPDADRSRDDRFQPAFHTEGPGGERHRSGDSHPDGDHAAFHTDEPGDERDRPAGFRSDADQPRDDRFQADDRDGDRGFEPGAEFQPGRGRSEEFHAGIEQTPAQDDRSRHAVAFSTDDDRDDDRFQAGEFRPGAEQPPTQDDHFQPGDEGHFSPPGDAAPSQDSRFQRGDGDGRFPAGAPGDTDQSSPQDDRFQPAFQPDDEAGRFSAGAPGNADQSLPQDDRFQPGDDRNGHFSAGAHGDTDQSSPQDDRFQPGDEDGRFSAGAHGNADRAPQQDDRFQPGDDRNGHFSTGVPGNTGQTSQQDDRFRPDDGGGRFSAGTTGNADRSQPQDDRFQPAAFRTGEDEGGRFSAGAPGNADQAPPQDNRFQPAAAFQPGEDQRPGGARDDRFQAGDPDQAAREDRFQPAFAAEGRFQPESDQNPGQDNRFEPAFQSGDNADGRFQHGDEQDPAQDNRFQPAAFHGDGPEHGEAQRFEPSFQSGAPGGFADERIPAQGDRFQHAAAFQGGRDGFQPEQAHAGAFQAGRSASGFESQPEAFQPGGASGLQQPEQFQPGFEPQPGQFQPDGEPGFAQQPAQFQPGGESGFVQPTQFQPGDEPGLAHQPGQFQPGSGPGFTQQPEQFQPGGEPGFEAQQGNGANFGGQPFTEEPVELFTHPDQPSPAVAEPSGPPAAALPSSGSAAEAVAVLRSRLEALGVPAERYRLGAPESAAWTMEQTTEGWRVGWFDNHSFVAPAVFEDVADASAFLLGKLLLDTEQPDTEQPAEPEPPREVGESTMRASLTDLVDDDEDDRDGAFAPERSEPPQQRRAPEAAPFAAEEEFVPHDPRPVPPRRPEPVPAQAQTGPNRRPQDWPIQPRQGEPPLTLFRGKQMLELAPGTEIDRYGEPGGNLTYAAGTPFERRSLVPDWVGRPYRAYRVLKPTEALTGVAIPWFDQPGGGTAYLLSRSVAELIDNGHLVEVNDREAPTRP